MKGYAIYVEDDDLDYLLEALHRLRELKGEAKRRLNATLVHQHNPFTDADFGIPEIDALTKRLEDLRED